jgi:protein-L-isoaspartate(D-aspartate) O-methyltransferase
MTIDDIRAWFAEDLGVTMNLQSAPLVAALGKVPRERFLGPGPWQFVGGDIRPRQTPSADPRHVYHNVSIAIDPARNLYNGQPGLLASWIDGLGVAPGKRVAHIGCATGYFSALMAEVVGPQGHVIAIEVDPDLAARAKANLASWPWARVVQGDGQSNLPGQLDALLVNAGATHILDPWLDAIADGGRLIVPLTSVMPGMPSPLGKGFVMMAQRTGNEWSAKLTSMVAIYSLSSGRDAAMEAKLGQAFMGGKMMTVARLRRDAHEPGPSCWLHGESMCLST